MKIVIISDSIRKRETNKHIDKQNRINRPIKLMCHEPIDR